MIDLSIIIINWNTRKLLAKCLQSISQNVLPIDGLESEIWVVDNHSTDCSSAMVKDLFPWVKLEENIENIGFVRGNNQVLKKLDSPYVLILNSDAIVVPDTVQQLICCMERHPLAGGVGPTLFNPDGTFQASYGSFPTVPSCILNLLGLTRLLYGPYYPSAGPGESTEKAVDWVGGACMLLRQSAVQDVGILDENIVMYAEEMDWCYRAHKTNKQIIFCPEAKVFHYGGASSKSSQPWILARQWQSILYFIGKHYGKTQERFLRTCVFIIGMLRAIVLSLLALIFRFSRKQLHAKAQANFNLARLETNYYE